jgi:tetratricopeptide (TPR) repeat protein
VATALDDLGIVLVELGRHAEALALHERGLAIRRKNDPASMDESLWNIGSLHANAGRNAQGLPYLLDGLARREAAMGREAPALALWHDELARTYDALGRRPDARRHRDRAAAIRAKEAAQLSRPAPG